MKDVSDDGSPVKARRQFIERNGLFLAAAALIRPGWALAKAHPISTAGILAGPEEPEISPVEDLMREHGVLSRILLIYEEILARLNRGGNFPVETLAASAGLVRSFVEDYHERLEEDHVFPRFEKAGKKTDLVRVLLAQHRAGRSLTERVKQAADPSFLKKPDGKNRLARDLALFIRMYRPHKAREDTVLFPAFRALLRPEEFMALGETFEDQEDKLFGQEGFEKVVAEVEQLEQTIGIHELGRFTPD